MPTLSFSWLTRRDGNDGFVMEECRGDPDLAYRREYGPMPPHIVPAFVSARRRIVRMVMNNSDAVATLE